MSTDSTGQLVEIPADGVRLEGKLAVPHDATGLATLLFDLLTGEKDRDYETRFDIDLLVEEPRVSGDRGPGRRVVRRAPPVTDCSDGDLAVGYRSRARWKTVLPSVQVW